jgi:hypothetical protein
MGPVDVAWLDERQDADLAQAARLDAAPRQAGRSGTRVPGVQAAAAAGGAVLATTLGLVGRLRAGRPLHPQGASYAARVRLGGEARSTVPWLDEPGSWRGTLRVSRGVGLPRALPDVYGIALRVDGPDGPFDLLLATTGTGPVGRLFFVPRPGPSAGALTTLLPVRSDGGPLVLCVTTPEGAALDDLGMPTWLELGYAHGAGPWHRAGEVLVGERLGPEAERARHDPVLHQLPDTTQYPVVRRLREPAYAAARSVPVR